jgi:transposase
MPLDKRTYKCTACGLKQDRDENSACNILLRFLARLEPDYVSLRYHKLLGVCSVLGVIQAIDTFNHV